jgi:virginiamycin A acetyltransferase
VVSDVPPYAVVGGNPAKPVKDRFPPEIVSELEAIAWWDWPIEKISKHLPVIVSADVRALRACADVKPVVSKVSQTRRVR